MALDDGTLRAVHVGAASLSIGLFLFRGARLVAAPQRGQAAWLRVTPHVVDTVLLGSAVLLAWQLGIAATRGWLPAKLTGVVLYIVLGAIALKRGRTLRLRVAAFAAAVITFAYVASVAITKSPLGFFA